MHKHENLKITHKKTIHISQDNKAGVSVSKQYGCLCSVSPESLMKLQMNRRQNRSMSVSLWRCLMGTHMKSALFSSLVPVFLPLRPDSPPPHTILQEHLWMVWQNCSFIYNSFSSQVKPMWPIPSETTLKTALTLTRWLLLYKAFPVIIRNKQ